MHDVRDWIAGIGWPLLVFTPLYLLLQLLVAQWTAQPTMIRPEVIARIMEQTEALGGAEGMTGAVSPAMAQIEALLDNVENGLSAWIVRLFGAGLVLAVIWSVAALMIQRRAFGPRAQKRAWPLWVGGAIALLGVAVFFYLNFFQTLRLDEIMTGRSFIGSSVAIVLVAIAAYWLSTKLAASPVMKPSVPGGTLLSR